MIFMLNLKEEENYRKKNKSVLSLTQSLICQII